MRASRLDMWCIQNRLLKPAQPYDQVCFNSPSILLNIERAFLLVWSDDMTMGMGMRSLNVPLINGLAGLAFVVLTLVILIVGQPIIMPVALAILFAFILTPVVRGLESLHLSRIAAVCVLVAFGTVCLASLVIMAGVQANDLVGNLPTYWDKTDSFVRHFAGENAFLMKMWDPVQQLVKPQLYAGEIAAKEPGAASMNFPGLGSWLSSISGVLVSLLAPLANLVAIIVLTIFMLIFREDIRNRFIGALGETRLLNTTRVWFHSLRPRIQPWFPSKRWSAGYQGSADRSSTA